MRVVAGLLAAVTLSFLAACTPAEQDKRLVATINGQKITVGDLLTKLRRNRGPSVLVEMMDTRLVLAAAAQQGLEVDDDEMRVRLQRAISEVGSEADFEARLDTMKITREKFMERLRVDLLLDKLTRAEMRIHEQEVKDFYREHRREFRRGERVKARMMLFDSREDADTVHEALQQPGSDFAGLARALSTDPATKDRGGDMGYFERADYAGEISDVAFALEVGQLSAVFEAPDGYCILKVEDRKRADTQPLSEVAEEIRARIMVAKLPSARGEWILKVRQAASITIADQELRESTLEVLLHAPPPQPVYQLTAISY